MDLSSVIKTLNSLRKKYNRTREFSVGETTFVISLLSESADREAVRPSKNAMNEESLVSYGRQVRIKVLANAIVKIDGQDIPDVFKLEDGTELSKIEYLSPVIDSFPSVLVDRLWTEYESLESEGKKAVSSVVTETTSSIKEDEKNPVVLDEVESMLGKARHGEMTKEGYTIVEGGLDQNVPELPSVPTAEEIGVEFTGEAFDKFAAPPVKFKEGALPDAVDEDTSKAGVTSSFQVVDESVVRKVGKPVRVRQS